VGPAGASGRRVGALGVAQQQRQSRREHLPAEAASEGAQPVRIGRIGAAMLILPEPARQTAGARRAFVCRTDSIGDVRRHLFSGIARALERERMQFIEQYAVHGGMRFGGRKAGPTQLLGPAGVEEREDSLLRAGTPFGGGNREILGDKPTSPALSAEGLFETGPEPAQHVVHLADAVRAHVRRFHLEHLHLDAMRERGDAQTVQLAEAALAHRVARRGPVAEVFLHHIEEKPNFRRVPHAGRKILVLGREQNRRAVVPALEIRSTQLGCDGLGGPAFVVTADRGRRVVAGRPGRQAIVDRLGEACRIHSPVPPPRIVTAARGFVSPQGRSVAGRFIMRKVPDITDLLNRWSAGDPKAFEELVPMVYRDLKRVARRALANEGPVCSLDCTALVHEAYLRLVDQERMQWNGRGHFFGAAALAMRRILVEQARHRLAKKRGEGVRREPLEKAIAVALEPDIDVIALDGALSALAAADPESARVVELRYFGGLSVGETAEVMGTSASSVTRLWTYARAWLYRRLKGDGTPPATPA
jgi:RNA polymerase sigma factor (TIGR02999 family)